MPGNLQVMTRTQAALWACGAVVAFLIAALPHSPKLAEPAFYALGAAGAAVAALLAWRAGRLPLWVLQATGLLATALVSTAVLLTGTLGQGAGSDSEMLYLWIVIYSAYFLSLRGALLQVGWVALGYWVVLSQVFDSSAIASRWVPTVGTLAVIVVLVQALRNRIGELVERLAGAARTDPLTGLQNRRGFEETFAIEVERARRHDRPLSVLVGDLDHFKLVNDRLGHPAGDAALVRVGELLRSGRRSIDPVARSGGEEFTVILPEAGEKDAYIVGERLRVAVERAFARGSVPLTMSFGIATYPEHGGSADDLLAAADQALYAAKQLGRNRTVIFSEELSSLSPALARGARAAEVHLSTLLALAEALDLRDTGTAHHSRTVGRYARMIARELGLPEQHGARIQIAGQLHDIGKIGLPDAILRRPGPLDEERLAEMRRHPEIGADILGSADFADVRSWILAHHERPDGKGYPHGLRGDEIPLEARIIAVADAYEAMTADRVYRPSLGSEAARGELLRGAGTQFDRRVVEALLRALERETREALLQVRSSDPARQ